MKKISFVLSSKEFLHYVGETLLMFLKGLIRVPCALFLGVSSLSVWLYGLVKKFCIEHTKAAVIIGFALCFMAMFVEFVYFKLKLQESSYQTSQLIQKNYQLEQTDRYDIGYHDAMAKNLEMLRNSER